MLSLIWSVVLSILVFSYLKRPEQTLASLSKSLKSIWVLLPSLLGMIAFVGLVLAIFPEERLLHLFAFKSLWGFVWVSLVGALVSIPGPIAFSLAGTLMSMGAPPSALASFITTLTMVGVASAGMEISYFGLRFTIMRQMFSFLAAIAIGLIMGALL